MTDSVETRDDAAQQNLFASHIPASNAGTFLNPITFHHPELLPIFSEPYLNFDPAVYERGNHVQQAPQNTHGFGGAFEPLDTSQDPAPETVPQDVGQTTPHPRPTSLPVSTSAEASVPPVKPTQKRKLDSKLRPTGSESAKGKSPLNSVGGRSRSALMNVRMPPASPSPPSEERSGVDKIRDGGPGPKKSAGATTKPQAASDSGPSRPTIDAPTLSGLGIGNSTSIHSKKASSNPTTTILPAEKMFPIQIGSETFRLSGASIASDAPSYFSQFFEDQIKQNEESGGVRTLYIDRDPFTFRDISRHLQGYHVQPLDGGHFVRLFADAQFYSLPRLISQLFESEIFIQIGDRHFQIPRDIFSSPGDSPNFFSLGFAVFFSTPAEAFPGLDRKELLRPPSILPPCVPHRSAETFAQLLHLLRGYPLHIKNEDHRSELLRDCRYFHLRGLEQKIIAHDISFNLERQKIEICIRLEDIRRSGISLLPETNTAGQLPSWVHYARPFVEDTPHELILEIGHESTLLDLSSMRADFQKKTKDLVCQVLQVIANKMNLPTNAPLGLMMITGGPSAHAASPSHTPLTVGEDRVKVSIDQSTDIMLDGKVKDIEGLPPTEPSASDATMSIGSSAPVPSPSMHGTVSGSPVAKKRKRPSAQGDGSTEWTIRRGQWRLKVDNNSQGALEITFIAVKLDALTGGRARNSRREWLS